METPDDDDGAGEVRKLAQQLGDHVGRYSNKDVVAMMTPVQLTESDPNDVVRDFLRRVGVALAQ